MHGRSAMAGAAVVTALLGASPAAGATGQHAFGYTGGEQLFFVPAGVTRVNVLLIGGAGGIGYNLHAGAGAPGGDPAAAVATLSVVAGERLYVEVGGDGAQGVFASGYGGGGFNGGGQGGNGQSVGNAAGGGGGGATDVRLCSRTPGSPGQPAVCAGKDPLATRLVVAGGGGGGGGEGLSEIAGGPGGPAGIMGGTGLTDSHANAGGTGGGPGGPTSPGTPGTNSEGGASAGPGTFGVGGAGGGFNGGGGGGGGGGLYGGGGGGGGNTDAFGYYGAGGGGGGGSSGVPAGTRGVFNFSTESIPAGMTSSVTFTWTLPPPAAVTLKPSGISRSAATLRGTVNPDGSLITSCRFVLAQGAKLRSIPCRQQVGAGTAPVLVTGNVAGLRRHTAYRVWLVAKSAQGTSSGKALQFVTRR